MNKSGNSKFEIRNSKQLRMLKIRNPKRHSRPATTFRSFGFWVLGLFRARPTSRISDFEFRISRVFLCLGLSMAIFLAGCDMYLPGPSYSEIKIPPEKTRQIETLQLKEAQAAQAEPPEANEVPPEKLSLSLEQCRAFALTNNLQLKATLIDPTIAAERLSEEEAKFEASFLANVSMDQREGQSVSQYTGIYGTVDKRTTTDLGVQVPLRTGGSVQFDVADSRISSNAPGVLADPYYESSASISLSQPLLRNAGEWFNTHSIRLAGYESQITDARTKLEVITVLAAVDRVYWRLYAARRELEVRKQQHDLALAQLDQVRRLVDVGQRAEVEIVRAEAGVAQQLEAIIIAENNLRDREREAKRVIQKPGLDMRSPTVVIPMTEPDLIRYDLDRAQLVRTGMDMRMELLELQLQLLEDASNLDFARNQTLPLVTLGYSYNVSGAGITRGDSYDVLFDNTFNNQHLGLQATIPIGNEAAKSRLRQAIYERRKRLATRKDRESTVEQEVLNAADSVETNWQRILAARQNTILQNRLYEAEKRQFEVGLRTSTDVLDAQTKFADAQSSEITALAEYQIALVDLAYATGTILGADRIQWEPIVSPTSGE
jgi:outer membrane protein